MRILIAPDKFKGTLSARSAVDRMKDGALAALPDAVVSTAPMADGGEGTVLALACVPGARVDALEASGPSGTWTAPMVELPDRSLCIEVASTSRRGPDEDALSATTFGTGEALLALYERDPSKVVVAVGGTSSTDGGTGIAVAHGWRFLDDAGNPIRAGGAGLCELARIASDVAVPPPCPVVALCDVRNPVVGPTGSARTFGPQKGASPEDVDVLEAGLLQLVERIEADLGLSLRGVPMSGAGGGVGAGLKAFLGADLQDGFETIAQWTGLVAEIERSDLVVTGEGRLDEGSLQGKVTTGVARAASSRGIPVLAVCGDVALDELQLEELGFAAVGSMASELGTREAMSRPAQALATVTRKVLEAWHS